jgi:hypothetical protein
MCKWEYRCLGSFQILSKGPKPLKKGPKHYKKSPKPLKKSPKLILSPNYLKIVEYFEGYCPPEVDSVHGRCLSP